MGATTPRTRITCKAWGCKCTAEHSYNILFVTGRLFCKQLPYLAIVYKTFPITHSCINSYFYTQIKIYTSRKLLLFRFTKIYAENISSRSLHNLDLFLQNTLLNSYSETSGVAHSGTFRSINSFQWKLIIQNATMEAYSVHGVSVF